MSEPIVIHVGIPAAERLVTFTRLTDEELAGLNAACRRANGEFVHQVDLLRQDKPIPVGVPMNQVLGDPHYIVASDHRVVQLLTSDQQSEVLETGTAGEKVAILLSRMKLNPGAAARAPLQRELSRLLVANPALMDPTVLIGVQYTVGADLRRTQHLGYMTISQAIAISPVVSLPREAHGISRAELQAFARNPSVIRGLNSEPGVSPLLFPAVSQITAPAAALVVCHEACSTTIKFGYFASLLELAELHGTPPARRSSLAPSLDPDLLVLRLGNVFWGLAASKALDPESDCSLNGFLESDLYDTFVRMSSWGSIPASTSPVRPADGLDPSSVVRDGPMAKRYDFFEAVATALDDGVFGYGGGDSGGMGPYATMNLTPVEVGRTVGQAAQLLVAIGLVDGTQEAAQLIADMAFGNKRRLPSAVPVIDCEDQQHHAIAFVDALHGVGARPVIDMRRVEWAKNAGRWDKNPQSPHEAQQYHLWNGLIESRRKHLEMSEVIACAAGTHVPDAQAAAPARRRRSL